MTQAQSSDAPPDDGPTDAMSGDDGWTLSGVSSGPTYRHIAHQLAEDIRSGRYKPGDRLPPHRILANRLGVAIATVSRAYAELSRIGLTSGEQGRGTFVRRAPYRPSMEAIPEPEPSGEIDLSINQPAVSPKHAAALDAALQTLSGERAIGTRRNLLSYQPSAGQLRHREAAVQWLEELGVSVPPDAVVLASGIQHAVMIACASAFRPGDILLTEALTNPSFRALASLFRLRIAGVAMDREGLLPEALERACREQGPTGLYCMPSLQNPTGAVMSEERRAQIADIAARYHLTVLENAAYDPLLPDPPVSLRSLLVDRGVRTFYVSALSKVVAAGIRIAYVVPPSDFAPQVASAVFATTTMAPQIMAEIASRWIADGTVADLIAWQRAEALARRAIVADRLPGLIDAEAPACNHLWLPLPEPWRADQIIALARRRGLLLAPPETFTVGQSPTPQAVRMSLGAARDHEALAIGAETLSDILEGAPLLPYSLT